MKVLVPQRQLTLLTYLNNCYDSIIETPEHLPFLCCFKQDPQKNRRNPPVANSSDAKIGDKLLLFVENLSLRVVHTFHY